MDLDLEEDNRWRRIEGYNFLFFFVPQQIIKYKGTYFLNYVRVSPKKKNRKRKKEKKKGKERKENAAYFLIAITNE